MVQRPQKQASACKFGVAKPYTLKKPAKQTLCPNIALNAKNNFHIGRSTLRHAMATMQDTRSQSKAHRRVLKLRCVTLIEQYGDTNSTAARWVARARGDGAGKPTVTGASLRISLPRDLQKLYMQGKPLPSDSPVAKEPPSLQRGCCKTWFLNLNTKSHRNRFESFLKEVKPAPGTSVLHFHSAPPCTWASPLQHMNQKRHATLKWTRVLGRRQLNFTRKCHRTFAAKSTAEWCKPCVLTQSHEQSARASVNVCKVALGNKKSTTTFPRAKVARKTLENWPWAIGKSIPRAEVAGCAVSLASAEKPSHVCGKKWCFETNNAALAKVLGTLRCSRDHNHVRVVRTRGRKAIGSKCSGHYPSYLGAMIGAALALTKN